MHIAEFASDDLTRLLNRVVFQINTALRSCGPEAIHDLRVSIRRFHEGLAVFPTRHAGKRLKKMRRFQKTVLAAAGEVRDYDVALQLLERIQAGPHRSLRLKLEAQRKAAATALIERLRRWQDRQLSSKWRHELQAANLAQQGGRLPVEEAARANLPARAGEFLRCGEEAVRPRATARKLHDFRLALKKFRYSLELFAKIEGGNTAVWFEQLKRTQQLLGAVNDCRTARSTIASLGKHRQIEAALKNRQRRKMSEFRRFWAREFAGTSAGKWAFSSPRALAAVPRKPMGPSLWAVALAAAGT